MDGKIYAARRMEGGGWVRGECEWRGEGEGARCEMLDDKGVR